MMDALNAKQILDTHVMEDQLQTKTLVQNNVQMEFQTKVNNVMIIIQLIMMVVDIVEFNLDINVQIMYA